MGGGGDGIDDKGNYAFNILRMKSDGSFHNDFLIDAQKAMKAGVKMLLSLTRDTQTQVVEVPIDVYGNAVIDQTAKLERCF